jgi:hypothetical protein
MTIYRLPFDDDDKWQFLGLGNWDDPASGGHQHYAFDFRHPVGGVVRAARDGVVAFVENHDGNIPAGDNVPGYGTAILIRHIDSTVADYEHLKFNSPKVVKGQYVLQGEIIALSGNTGNSHDPHLHFGLSMFWNSDSDRGPGVPIQFEDKNHVAWRPFIGDALASNNSVLRQEGWKWCSKCQGLYYSGKPSSGSVGGKCPASGTHTDGGSANYILVLNTNVPGQAGWRWCSKCQGLFFGGNPGSKCPAGEAHSDTGGGNYVLAHNSPDAPGQANWRWCKKCQGLFFAGNPGSKCPAGATHSKTGSGNYTLLGMGSGDPQQDWRRCKKCQGLFFGGNPGSNCPAGAAHDQTGSSNYVLVHDYLSNSAPGQPEWRWCNKCQGLFYAGSIAAAHLPSPCKHFVGEIKNLEASIESWSELLKKASPPEKSDIAQQIKEIKSEIAKKKTQLAKCVGDNRPCPAGGNHSKTGSGNYVLVNSTSPKAPGEPGWRWCRKCQGLFFGGNSGSKCPAGAGHSQTGSGNYRLLL